MAPKRKKQKTSDGQSQGLQSQPQRLQLHERWDVDKLLNIKELLLPPNTEKHVDNLIEALGLNNGKGSKPTAYIAPTSLHPVKVVDCTLVKHAYKIPRSGLFSCVVTTFMIPSTW